VIDLLAARAQMAVSLAFGVVFSTFVTLVLVPAGYQILDDAAVRAVLKLGTLGPSSANKSILLPVRFRIL